MTTLTEFLLARFADLEADVRNRKTYAVGHSERCIFEGGYEGSGSCDCGAVDRVLADVEAKRAIVGLYSDALHLVMVAEENDYSELAEYLDRRDALEPALRALATIWADHPDYDESWRP